MTMIRGPRRAAFFAMTFLALAACDSEPDENDLAELPDPAMPVEEAEPDPEATTSILRADIEQPETEDEEPVVELEPLRMTINFPEGGTQLNETAIGKIEDLAQSQQVKEGGDIILRGHSDAGGTGEANMRASRARAERVRQQLLVHDIASDRIAIIAFGEQNPVRPNALPDGSPNEMGRAANRRVEITVTVNDGDEAESREPEAEAAEED